MSSPQPPHGRLCQIALCAGLVAGLTTVLLPEGVRAQPAVSRAVEVSPPKGWTPDMPLFAADEEPVAGSRKAAEGRGAEPARPVKGSSGQATSAVAAKRDASRGTVPPARATAAATTDPRGARGLNGTTAVRAVTNKAPESEHRKAGRAITRAGLRGASDPDRNTAAAPRGTRHAERTQPAPRRADERDGRGKARTLERAGAHPGPAQPAMQSHARKASLKAARPQAGSVAKPAAAKKGTLPSSRRVQPRDTHSAKGKAPVAPRKGTVAAAHQKTRR